MITQHILYITQMDGVSNLNGEVLSEAAVTLCIVLDCLRQEDSHGASLAGEARSGIARERGLREDWRGERIPQAGLGWGRRMWADQLSSFLPSPFTSLAPLATATSCSAV